MKYFSALLMMPLLIYSCESNSGKPGNNETDTASVANTIVKNDSVSAVEAIHGFLNWYKEELIPLSRINLVDQVPGKNYSVNLDSCRKFISELEESGNFTPGYLAEKMKRFEEKKKELEADPQTEGPPYGFEFDQVMLVQDIDSELDSLPSFKVVQASVNTDTALVDFTLYYEYEFMLLKENGNWLVNRILLVGDE